MSSPRKQAEIVYDELAKFYNNKVGTSFPKKDSSFKTGFINMIQEALEESYEKGYEKGREDERDVHFG